MFSILHAFNQFLNTLPEAYKTVSMILFLLGLALGSLVMQWYVFLQEEAKHGLR